MDARCIVCSSGEAKTKFFRMEAVALSATAVTSEQIAAGEVSGSLTICQCRQCGHVYNEAFDPGLLDHIYTQGFASALNVTDAMRRKTQGILSEAIGSAAIHGARVVEVGASNFAFSTLLSEHGAAQVVAFEPSSSYGNVNDAILHVPRFYEEPYIGEFVSRADLVVMRHVVEHLIDPGEKLAATARHQRPGSLLYIEVPNVDNIVAERRIYDFFYEHVSYFSPSLLGAMLTTLGYEVVRTSTLAHGQHFGMLARRLPQAPRALNGLSYVGGFGDFSAVLSKAERFDADVRALLACGEPTAIYGAGAHAVYVIARLGLSKGEITRLFDVNPLKHGKYAPLSHIPIAPPTREGLADFPQLIVIAPLHQAEICRDLREVYHYTGRIFTTEPEVGEFF